MCEEENEYNLENRLRSEFNLGQKDLEAIRDAINDHSPLKDEVFNSDVEREKPSGKEVIAKVQNIRKILSTVSNEMSDIVAILHISKQQVKQEKVQNETRIKVLRKFIIIFTFTFLRFYLITYLSTANSFSHRKLFGLV